LRLKSTLRRAGYRLGLERGVSLTEMMVCCVMIVSVLGIVTQIFIRSSQVYDTQRQYVDAQYSTAAALDMVVRLLRSATMIDPDPDGNGMLDSVRVVSDWNPRDGDTGDSYENVTFTTSGGTLFKREPPDAGPVAFADRVASLSFAYFDPAGNPVATPWLVGQNRLGYLDVTLSTTGVNGRPGVTTSASASVRRTE